MAGYEPWDGDNRTWYNTTPPEPDVANPFLEFDPQMCIICTRCVRACDELRHTGALTLAGRGPRARIAFGANGPIHESNCDFCGACIDVCPTATLMEHPNKWSATQTEHWTATTCMQCSVGCAISIGSKRGRGVIVRPDANANPVSRDQVCVRGRFHYDAVKHNSRLGSPLIRRNGGQEAADWDEALEFTVARLAQVREEHGPGAIGFLGSAFATNEENYLLSKIARAVVGTNNVDSSIGPVSRAAAAGLRNAFGTEVLPADMQRLARSKTVLVVGEDLESSHNIACLRIKDAAVWGGAELIVVSAQRGELNDFADVWIQPKPGEEAAAVAALAAEIDPATGAGEKPAVPNALAEPLAKAIQLLATAANDQAHQPLSIVYALPHYGPTAAGAVTAALANIAVACARGEAAEALFVLPQEANVIGLRDTGGSPDLLPGYRPAGDEAARREMQRLWGAPVPAAPGLTFDEMAANGHLKALVVLNDNPLMLAPDRARVQRMLKSLDFLAVIDSLPTATAQAAHVVLPDMGPWAKEGTTTSAGRRVLRMHQTTAPAGDARQAWQILAEIGSRLAGRVKAGEIRLNYRSAAEIMDEMANVIPLYCDATYREMEPGRQQAIDGLGPKTAARQAVAVPALSLKDGFRLSTGRSLFMSYEGAAVQSAEADKLHRDDAVRINPADAAALGVADGDMVALRNAKGSVTVRAALTAAVQQKALHLPLYHDGGAVSALFDGDSPVTTVEIARA